MEPDRVPARRLMRQAVRGQLHGLTNPAVPVGDQALQAADPGQQRRVLDVAGQHPGQVRPGVCRRVVAAVQGRVGQQAARPAGRHMESTGLADRMRDPQLAGRQRMHRGQLTQDVVHRQTHVGPGQPGHRLLQPLHRHRVRGVSGPALRHLAGCCRARHSPDACGCPGSARVRPATGPGASGIRHDQTRQEPPATQQVVAAPGQALIRLPLPAQDPGQVTGIDRDLPGQRADRPSLPGHQIPQGQRKPRRVGYCRLPCRRAPQP